MDEQTSNMIDDLCMMERAVSCWPHPWRNGAPSARDAWGLLITRETVDAAWEELNRLYNLAGGNARFQEGR